MKGDPYWTQARFRSVCARCNAAVTKGARIYYFPCTRSVFCDSAECGQREAASFEAARSDEAMGSHGRPA